MNSKVRMIILYFNFHFISTISFSQKSFNIVCRDFTFQQFVSSYGKNLRNVFEVVISKSNYPFKVLERDKIDKIFESLQEEKNLVKDLSNEWKKKLQIANVDYLVVGDINENLSNDTYDLLINFIKITGNNMTEKLPMLITLSRKQISNSDELRRIFEKEIDSFLKSYFINETEDNDLTTIPKFYEELKKRDSLIAKLEKDDQEKSDKITSLSNSISGLQTESQKKNKEINKLNKDISDIKDYSEVAKLNMYGLPFDGVDVLFSSQLSRLMDNILQKSDNNIVVKSTDSSLYYSNIVINNFPFFPFGYYSKATILRSRFDNNWIVFAKKAMEILEITTSIYGHHFNHDQVIKTLRLLMK
jgi:hypothetical protein